MRTNQSGIKRFFSWISNSFFVKNKIFKSLFLVFLSSFLFISSVVKVKGLTIFHAYTFGLIFGYSSYLFYFFLFLSGFVGLFSKQFFKNKFVKNHIFSRVRFITALILFLGIGLLIEFGINVSMNRVWFGYEDFGFSLVMNWNVSFELSNDAMFPNTLNMGLWWAIVGDLLSLLGTNLISLFAGIICFIYIILVGIYKYPFKLFFNKEYRTFVKYNKSIKSTRIQENSTNNVVIEQEIPLDNSAMLIENKTHDEPIKVEEELTQKFELEKNEKLSITKEIELNNIKPKLTVNYELVNNPFWNN